jgi:hypothetical protein
MGGKVQEERDAINFPSKSLEGDELISASWSTGLWTNGSYGFVVHMCA